MVHQTHRELVFAHKYTATSFDCSIAVNMLIVSLRIKNTKHPKHSRRTLSSSSMLSSTWCPQLLVFQCSVVQINPPICRSAGLPVLVARSGTFCYPEDLPFGTYPCGGRPHCPHCPNGQEWTRNLAQTCGELV